MKTDTAYEAWNSRWATEDGRADWLTPDRDVVELSEALLAAGKLGRALDLGCGVGRHAMHFARLGFETYAVDMAEAGVSELRAAAADAGLKVVTDTAPMTALPFPDNHFDYVLSFNVIYHGDEPIVRQAISEIRRVLKPGGEIIVTSKLGADEGFVPKVEEWLAPLMRKVGWSSHFKVSRLERWAAKHPDMDVVEVAPVFPAGFFKLVRIRKKG